MLVIVIVKMVPELRVEVISPLKFRVILVVPEIMVLVIETVVLAPPVLST